MSRAGIAEGCARADLLERSAAAIDLWPQALGWSAQERAARTPGALVRPRSAEEAADCLGWLAERGLPVSLRGGGTGVVGAAIPEPGGSVLDLSGLRGGLETLGGDPPRVRVSAGWRGRDLEPALERLGLSLRHVPQSLHDSCVGGWVAHDGYGQLSTRFGGIRAQIERVRVAGLDGSIAWRPAAEHLGAEGTLGALVEVELRVRPLPRGRRFLSWTLGDLDETAAFARALALATPPPSVLRAYSPVDRIVHSMSSGGGSLAISPVEAALLRRPAWLNAASALAGRRWTLLAVYEDEAPYGDVLPDEAWRARGAREEPARAWWERRFQPDAGRLRRVFAAGCFADTADLWAPYARLAALEAAVRRAAAERAFAYAHLSHFDGEGACLYVTMAGAGGSAAHAGAWGAIMDACVAAGGRVNHHHGIGRAKARWRTNALGEERIRALEGARRLADPARLLNPGAGV